LTKAEMLALCWKDVDMQGGFLTIEKSRSMAKNRSKENENDKNYIMVEGTTKNEKARTIKLTEKALEILRQIKTTYGENDGEAKQVVMVPAPMSQKSENEQDKR